MPRSQPDSSVIAVMRWLSPIFSALPVVISLHNYCSASAASSKSRQMACKSIEVNLIDVRFCAMIFLCSLG